MLKIRKIIFKIIVILKLIYKKDFAKNKFFFILLLKVKLIMSYIKDLIIRFIKFLSFNICFLLKKRVY